MPCQAKALRAFSKVLALFTLVFGFTVSAHVSKEKQQIKRFQIPFSQVYTINSTTLKRDYELFVKVPPDYHKEENKNRQYPVIYMNDGTYAFQVVSGILEPGTYGKNLEPVILVGISHALGESGMHSRIRDYTPLVEKSWKPYLTGEAPNYLSFIKAEVFPFIEKNYRASDKNRTLTGHSVGGLFAIYTLFTEPSLFTNYIISSPVYLFKPPYIFDSINAMKSKFSQINARVYLASGSKELIKTEDGKTIADIQKSFAKQLNSQGFSQLEVKSEIASGAVHHTVFPMAFANAAFWMFTIAK